ncbi:MAG TPA: preprotein translocase subunit YajC [Candidatus Cybelea sp.]|nr:preprotein translocase subunit YajC [Candidatus Cybelea sp.]
MPDLSNLGNLEQLLPFALVFVAFYFLLIRPQQKRAQDHKRMVEALRRGDTVVTGGGFLGKVVKVMEDGTVQVEIAENVRVRVVKSTITEVRTKGDAAAVAAKTEASEGGKGSAPANDPGPAKKGGLLSNGLLSMFKK